MKKGENKPLKYLGYDIVFQEVPDEISLAINISGCPHKCEGCHSQYLWEYKGEEIKKDLPDLLEKYKNLITCVCFMGGEQNSSELIFLAKKTKEYKLKVALYSGENKVCKLNPLLFEIFDYIKIGSYNMHLGGLSSKTTNQIMYKKCKNQKEDDYQWEDITYRFWKGESE